MRRTVAVWFAICLAACSSGEKNAHVSTPPTDSIPQGQGRPLADTAAPLSTSLADLKKHEGRLVRVLGTFRFPPEKAFARNELILDDSTIVVLDAATEKAAAPLVAANHGARMTISGRIFTQEIPASYRIIGRTPDPYLVDIIAVEIGQK